MTTASVGFVSVKEPTAPGQEQVVGGVGRWGRMTGTQGQPPRMVHRQQGLSSSAWIQRGELEAGSSLSPL